MKSKDITKYDPAWQMTRVEVKGSNTSIPDKLRIVDDFFRKNRTVDNQERVLNWLDGLWKGIKRTATPEIEENINNARVLWLNIRNLPKEQPKTPEETREILLTYPLSKRLLLWKDLYARTKGWGSYLHKEQDAFMKVLASTIQPQDFKAGTSFADYNKMVENPGEGNWKGVY
jgi:hypothetical protein